MAHNVVSKWVPLCWEAFLDYHIRAVNLSALEIQILSLLLNGRNSEAETQMRAFGWLEWDEEKNQLKRNRERDEFFDKLRGNFDFPLDLLASARGPTKLNRD